MSIVTISQTLGSLGDEIGRELAQTLRYELADREIILKAAEQFGEAVTHLEHMTEDKPTLWERLTETRQRYLAYVEAVVWELAARDDVVLVGRGASVVLRNVRHALRVRISAPEHLRARRLEDQRGLVPDALDAVRHSDRERAARIRFLYHMAWDDPLHYDLILNTERLDVRASVQVIQASLRADRLQPTPASRAEVRDLSLAARGSAALLANPTTRQLRLFLGCQDGHLSISGRVTHEELSRATEEVCLGIPGVLRVTNEILVASPTPSLAPF